MRPTWPAAAVLLVLLVAFRALSATFPFALPNFSPLPALFLCSVVFFRGTHAWALPLAAWLVSTPLANALQGYPALGQTGPTLAAILTLLGLGALALTLRPHARPRPMLAGSLAAALLFHLMTSAAAWAFGGRYSPDGHGFFQAVWSGLPTDALPSWAFFRNLAAANLLFTGLFLAARAGGFAPTESPALARASRAG